MTTYTDEVNIYNPEAIQEGINQAGTTASAYITEVSADSGIVVAPVGKGTVNKAITSATTGWHLADVLEYIRNGVSRFWIGLKKSTDTTPTVRIGKAFVNGASDNESHMELDYHSLQMIDKNGTTYFHVSDLRGANGTVEVTDSYEAVESGTTLGVNYNIVEVVEVLVNGVAVAVRSFNYLTVEVASTVSAGSAVEITYKTNSEIMKSYTAGTRWAGSENGPMSFAEGIDTIASGVASHVEGANSTSSGHASHAEGIETEATSAGAHAEGTSTHATGDGSHAEGVLSRASGSSAHAEGRATIASGARSHAQNRSTEAGYDDQTAIGRFNDNQGANAFEVGNGTAGARSNALAVQWNGHVDLWPTDMEPTDGAITVHSPSEIPMSQGSAVSANQYDNLVGLVQHDTSDVDRAHLRMVSRTDGRQGVQVETSRLNASGAAVHNGLDLFVAADGTRTVGVSESKPWREALGANSSGVWPANLGGTGQTSLQATRNAMGLGNTTGALPIANGGTGTSEFGATKNTSGSNVSCPNNTNKQLASISLEAGTWIILAGFYCAGGSGGRRVFFLNGSSSASYARLQTVTVPVGDVNADIYQEIVRVVSHTATTTYYAHGNQNSGSAKNMSAYLYAIRLK